MCDNVVSTVRFSLLKLVKFSFLVFSYLLLVFITPMNKDYHKLTMIYYDVCRSSVKYACSIVDSCGVTTLMLLSYALIDLTRRRTMFKQNMRSLKLRRIRSSTVSDVCTVCFRRGDEKNYRVYSDEMRPLEQRVLRKQRVKVCHAATLGFTAFCVSRRRRKMYCGHARLCVCVSVCLSDCPRPYAHTTARTRM